MADSLLKKYSQNDKNLRFDDNGEIVGTYRGVHEEDDPFEPGDKRLVYVVEGQDKIQRNLASKSKRLAKAFYESDAKAGDHIQIMRFGSGYETVYKVKVLTKNQPETKTETQEEEIPF